jgi:hypothetical protein
MKDYVKDFIKKHIPNAVIKDNVVEITSEVEKLQ